MRAFSFIFGLIAGLQAGGLAAQDTGTVVELYTSQGCSSCPPADELITRLAERTDVIPLSLHVDYWDYIGWEDDLAQPAFTQRQRRFAHAAGSNTVYTPQLIINGADAVVGSHAREAEDIISAHKAAKDPVAVSLARRGDRLDIRATVQGEVSDRLTVQMVRYAPSIVRDITRGENAGRTIVYTNVVTSWQALGTWRTDAPLAMQAELAGDGPVVVIVQDGTDGPIMGAARLR